MIRKNDPQAVAPYLRDASNYSGGFAEEVLIPETVDDLVIFLRTNKKPVTIAGAGTGLTASRIPKSGVIVSLERFKGIAEPAGSSIEVGPAVSLQELQVFLQSTSFFYPPNPTETLASIGGTLATNASGSRSYKFGVTRDYVQEAEIVLVDGRKVRLSRGVKITRPLELEDGSRIVFPDIGYTSPKCKNAAGYYIQPNMDWLDLFIGSDGTLGIFTKIRLRLLSRPADFISAILFFNEEEDCWRLVERIRSLKRPEISPCSLEYFDFYSLEKLKAKYGTIPERAKAALFFEQDVAQNQDYDPTLEAWFQFLGAENVLLDDSWFAQNTRDQKKFHDFRHHVPVMVNEENSRLRRVKVGTDMAVPNDYFMEMMRFYREELSRSGLAYVMFGHLGDNHLHINFLPDAGETELTHTTYQKLVNQILTWGGTVSAEHGIGKLKKEYFAEMVGEKALQELRQIKNALDPESQLGSGNII